MIKASHLKTNHFSDDAFLKKDFFFISLNQLKIVLLGSKLELLIEEFYSKFILNGLYNWIYDIN